MERVIVNAGTKTNLYELFEDLQDYIRTNQWNLISPMIEQYGIFANLTPTGDIDPSDTSMKVTGVPGQSYVSIGAGDAITRTQEHLTIPPGQTTSVAGLSTGPHVLYLKHTLSYDTPVDVMSGFAYGLSGIAKNSSRVHDITQVVWDMDPTVSGIVLAEVEVFAGTFASVTDMRPYNLLKFSTSVMPSEVIRTDFTDVQTMSGALGTTQLNVHSTNTIIAVVSGLTTVFTLSLAQLQQLISQSANQSGLSIGGTTAASFRVGNSAIGADDGDLVQLAPADPKMPLNIRITDIQSPTLSNTLTKDFMEKLATPVRTGLLSPFAAVYLKWNWDDIQGDGSYFADTFTVTNSTGSRVWGTNVLAGYRLRVNEYEYDIVSNTATDTGTGRTNLVVTPAGHAVSISGRRAFGTDYALIHSNADMYEITAIPVTATGELVYSDRYETIVSAPITDSGPTIMSAICEILLGERVYIRVRAINGTQKSTSNTMLAGTYYKSAPFKSQQAYDAPALIKLPDLDSTGVKVGAASNNNGFTINIVGWDAATDYEIAYTTDPGGASFTNPNHRKIITSDKRVDVATTGRDVYYIAVRPLIAGQAVATPLTASVTSGSGDTTPKDAMLGPISIDFRTYSTGTLTVVSSNTYTAVATSDGSTCKLSPNMLGKSIYIGSTPYFIGEMYTGLSTTTDTIVLFTAEGLIATGLNGQSFTYGLTEDGRKLATFENLPMDITISKVFVELFSKAVHDMEREPVLRWYQEGRKDLADSIVLGNKKPSNYTAVTDLGVLASQGSRNLIFDLWDETGAENSCGFVGRITAYYVPVTRDSGK